MNVAKKTAVKKKWFDYPNDPDQARFEISVLQPVQGRKIKSQAQKYVMNENGQEVVFDIPYAGNLRAFAALTAWENVFADDEAAAAQKCLRFTAVNKAKLLDEVPGLEDQVLVWLKELTEEYEANLEVEEKNLSALANG